MSFELISDERMVETVLVLEDSSFWSIVFSDLIDLASVQLITPSVRWSRVSSKVAKKICRIHHSFRVNSVINLPFKSIWNRYDFIFQNTRDAKRWIFTDTSIREYDFESIKYLRERGNKLYLLFLNPLCAAYETEYAMKLVNFGLFDLVYTVDYEDAERNGYIFTNAVYSKKQIDPSNHTWKVSYVGSAKNRLSLLHDMAELLQKTNSIFYINGTDAKEEKALCNIVYNHPMDYGEVLQVVNKSDCIVEVLQKGQKGFTFRVYESLCYNKKLITNNSDIIKQKFYNSKYIKVYSDIDNSILDFINNGVLPDYHYTNQYSPIKLYEDILAREKNDSIE